MSHRRVSRAVALILLAWIGFDLAALDTCALDAGSQPVASDVALRASLPPSAAAHSRAVLHPDHCFCHGHSTGPGSPVALAEPVALDQAVPDTPREHLLQSSTALYHPPQRPA